MPDIISPFATITTASGNTTEVSTTNFNYGAYCNEIMTPQTQIYGNTVIEYFRSFKDMEDEFKSLKQRVRNLEETIEEWSSPNGSREIEDFDIADIL